MRRTETFVVGLTDSTAVKLPSSHLARLITKTRLRIVTDRRCQTQGQEVNNAVEVSMHGLKENYLRLLSLCSEVETLTSTVRLLEGRVARGEASYIGFKNDAPNGQL